MFRYELDQHRKIMVLVVHGTQDGWEGKMMIDGWKLHVPKIDSDWKLILDLGEYVSPHGYAEKEQRRLASMIASQNLAKKMLVRAVRNEVNAPFTEGISYDEHPDFLSAWRNAGGDSRDTLIPAPADGSHYPANNAPPRG